MGLFARTSEDLRAAAADGRPKDVRKYLNREISPLETDADGNNALHYAARSCGRDNVETLEVLCAAGMDINCRNAFGETPLFQCQDPKMVEALLRKGADINALSANGRTPLQHAAAAGREHWGVFLRHGAEINVQDKDGNSPLHLVCERTRRLFSTGLPVLHKSDAEFIQALVVNGAKLGLRNKDGKVATDLVGDAYRKEVSTIVQKAAVESSRQAPGSEQLILSPAVSPRTTVYDQNNAVYLENSSSVNDNVVLNTNRLSELRKKQAAGVAKMSKEMRQDLVDMCVEPDVLEAIPLPALEALIEEMERALPKLRSAAAKQRAKAQKRASRRRSTSVRNREECVVCMEAPREVLFNDCNHAVVCRACACKLPSNACPMCRTPITSVRQFFS